MEQATVERASKRTTLRLGEIEAPIGLYKISSDPAQRTWDRPPIEKPAAEAPPAPEEPKGDPLTGSSKASAPPPPKPSSPPADAPEKPRKGIYKADGAFVDLTDQIEGIAEETTLDRVEVVSFIRRESVPRERILGAYFVGAGKVKRGAGGYPPVTVIGLLYKSLRLAERAAVVRWGKRSRSSVGVMVPHRSGALLVLELAYAENMLAPNADCLSHQHLDLPTGQVEQMVDLIGAMAESRSSLDDVHDRRAELEAELVVRAEHGELDEFTATTYEADEQIGELGRLLEDSLKAAAAA